MSCQLTGGLGAVRTLSTDWEIQVLDLAKLTKDLVQMVLVDVFREAFDNNLHNIVSIGFHADWPDFREARRDLR